MLIIKRGALAATVCLVAALGLAGCSGSDKQQGAVAANSSSSSPTTPVAQDPLNTPGQTAAPTGTTGSGSGTATQPGASSSPKPGTPAPTKTTPTKPAPTNPTPTTKECDQLGAEFGPVNTTGISSAARSTAQKLFTAATRCDKAILVAMATKDKTSLSFGLISADKAFVLPQDGEKRYVNLARLLGMKPTMEKAHGSTTAIWPRVHTLAGSKDPAAWQEAVDAGLLTPAQAKQMQTAGSGYMGWRLGISNTGKWQYFIAGD